MKLKAYAEKLAALAEKYPDVDVVYAKDDEGNGFQRINYTPSVGEFVGGDFNNQSKRINAVCLN